MRVRFSLPAPPLLDSPPSLRPRETANLKVAEALGAPGGMQAANLKVAQLYIEAFSGMAKTNNTLIVPSNLTDVSTLVASAMTILDRSRPAAPAAPPAPRPAA